MKKSLLFLLLLLPSILLGANATVTINSSTFQLGYPTAAQFYAANPPPGGSGGSGGSGLFHGTIDGEIWNIGSGADSWSSTAATVSLLNADFEHTLIVRSNSYGGIAGTFISESGSPAIKAVQTTGFTSPAGYIYRKANPDESGYYPSTLFMLQQYGIAPLLSVKSDSVTGDDGNQGTEKVIIDAYGHVVASALPGGGASFNPASPGPIGGTSPSSGKFTNLAATSLKASTTALMADIGLPGMWFGSTNVSTPSYGNYSFLYSYGQGTILNSPSGENFYFRIGNVNRMQIFPSGGVYVGDTVADPGTNNLKVQDTIKVGSTGQTVITSTRIGLGNTGQITWNTNQDGAGTAGASLKLTGGVAGGLTLGNGAGGNGDLTLRSISSNGSARISEPTSGNNYVDLSWSGLGFHDEDAGTDNFFNGSGIGIVSSAVTMANILYDGTAMFASGQAVINENGFFGGAGLADISLNHIFYYDGGVWNVGDLASENLAAYEITAHQLTLNGIGIIGGDYGITGFDAIQTNGDGLVVNSAGGNNVFYIGEDGSFTLASGYASVDADGNAAFTTLEVGFSILLDGAINTSTYPPNYLNGGIVRGTDNHLYWSNGTTWKQLDN